MHAFRSTNQPASTDSARHEPSGHAAEPAAESQHRARLLGDAAQLLAAIRRQRVDGSAGTAVAGKPGVSLLLQAIMLPALLCAALVWATPHLFQFWKICLTFWFNRLDVPFQVMVSHAATPGLSFQYPASFDDQALPTPAALGLHAGLAALVFASSFFYPARKLPLAYLVRIVCSLQAMALLFFWIAPMQFPYSITSHLDSLLSFGRMLLLATPVLLAFGYYLLPAGMLAKIINTGIVLGYFILVIPHQVVLHALILQHGSRLYMPLLYLCFGVLLDVLLFIGLYSWIIGRLPPDPGQERAYRMQ